MMIKLFYFLSFFLFLHAQEIETNRTSRQLNYNPHHYDSRSFSLLPLRFVTKAVTTNKYALDLRIRSMQSGMKSLAGKLDGAKSELSLMYTALAEANLQQNMEIQDLKTQLDAIAASQGTGTGTGTTKCKFNQYKLIIS